MAVSMKMTVFLDVTSYSLDLMMEEVGTYETSVNLYEATRHNIPEDSHFDIKPV
jgi:hypothetical protein